MTLIVWAFKFWAWLRQVNVLKSWGLRYGIWFGIGWQSERTKLIERSWLRTVFPPYLRGVGFNLALRHFCFRLGLYRRVGNYQLDDYEDVDVEGELAALEWGMVEKTEEEISEWDMSSF